MEEEKTEMRYRVYFEPFDIELGDEADPKDYPKNFTLTPDVSKILPIGKDGFVIKQDVS